MSGNPARAHVRLDVPWIPGVRDENAGIPEHSDRGVPYHEYNRSALHSGSNATSISFGSSASRALYALEAACKARF